MSSIHRISVVIPMKNEVDHVERLIAELAEQDFEGDVEVLVADGGSTDGSAQLLSAAAAARNVELTVVDNPAGWVSHGLNACIRRATGDLIVRVDCHSYYPSDYLRRLALAATETGAWNVGGIVHPRGETDTERAVACAMDSPFGGIGWSRAAAGKSRRETDTVTYGAFRPKAFERVGLFDESLHRNQDDELSMRLRLAGGRIVLDPAVTVSYQPRGSLSAVFRQYYEYGVWKVPVMLKHRRVFSGRSLAPLGMVGSLALLGSLSPVSRSARKALTVEIAVYALAAAAFGAESVRRRGEPMRLLPRVIATFPAFHVGYGLGMARGWLRARRP